ncbi:ComEC/Rec2 family competence protein [Microbacterium sp. NEAU-LLC]|uniref:ComEC/Rec2 family competence protein n=1 Tax=Microbacterium helvum TaxID=2773713 RepID=A0ABR8NKA5_9MICO|nr:ComEC/Rec2 family competence protein [Microbacterium helvum]
MAAVAIHLPSTAAGLAVALWIAVALAIGVTFAIGRRGMPHRGVAAPLLVLVLSLAAAAASASHVALAQPARTQVSAQALDGGRAVDVDATVVGKVERRADGSLAFDAHATLFTTGRAAQDAGVEIVVRVDAHDVDRPDALDVGSRIVARGTARPAHAGERAVLTVWASRGVDVMSAPTGAAAATAALRQGLVRAVSGLPGAGAGLVPGLAVGDTSAVTPELDAAMKASSLSHLTAVSGANCALVVGIAFAVAALLGASRAGRVCVGMAVLVGFVVLVTPEPSVIRAAVMAAIAMLAVLQGRTAAGTAVLALSVAVLLITDPWLAASLGFALSVAATGALLLFARPLASGLGRVMPRALALALSIPLAAQLACGPLLVLIEPTIPLYGVLANLLAEPAAPAATVLGLAACLALPFPWLQSGLAALAWLPASWIAATAHTVSTLPAEALPWLEGWPGAVALAVVGAAVGAAIVLPRRGGRWRRRARTMSIVLVAVLAGVGLGSSALSSVAGRWTLPSQWSVLACDVGQGDAVLLRSAGMVALVDTGPDPAPLAACLDRVGVARIDLLVLTHSDLDHIGGVAAVLGRVGLVLHGPGDAPGNAAVRTLTSAGASEATASTGMSGALGDARWRVLWPRPDDRAFPAGNDASVVIDVRGGGIPPTLLLGDLSASPQRALTAAGGLDPPYAIVKVAHHGSADQDAGLYVAARPGVALVTVGTGNDYGHPRDETLAMLADVRAHIVRTDQEGIIALWSGDPGVVVWRERGG